MSRCRTQIVAVLGGGLATWAALFAGAFRHPRSDVKVLSEATKTLDSSTIPTLAPVHTYSIVARDPKTGELGVAVQSHYFAVGQIVPWAEPGVGAVATQSFVEPSYGPLGLELMRSGKHATEALRELVAQDPERDVRQVAMIDAHGRSAAYTGSRCIEAAGHTLGKTYSVQANMMVDKSVWPAMAAGFEKADGDLAQRMLSALEAAEAAGGDLRGRQSAALLVVSGRREAMPGRGTIVDIRVDDGADPLGELRRLLSLQRAYRHSRAADAAIDRNDNETASREFAAAQALAPDNLEMIYWHAVALANANRMGEALPLFRRVFDAEPNWITMTRRLAKAGRLPDDPAIIDTIVEQHTR